LLEPAEEDELRKALSGESNLKLQLEVSDELQQLWKASFASTGDADTKRTLASACATTPPLVAEACRAKLPSSPYPELSSSQARAP